MVARSVDNPRTVTERITSASQRIDEAVRAQGRGAPALRDSAGNVLLMNPAAPYPLLGPQGTDAAVAFTNDGTIKITSADTTEDRDMTVRDIASSGNVQANNLHADGTVTAVGDMTAVNFHATGQTTCNNLGANSANIGPLTAGDTSVGVLWSNVIHASGDMRDSRKRSLRSTRPTSMAYSRRPSRNGITPRRLTPSMRACATSARSHRTCPQSRSPRTRAGWASTRSPTAGCC
jgi:hypothetical protein